MFPFSLLSGFSVKLILVLTLVAGILGTGTALYFSIRHAGAIEQQLKDQKAEYERVIHDQETVIQNQKDILELNETSTADLSTQLEAITTKFQDLADFLDSDDAKNEDRPASELLKKVIEKLAKENGDK